MRGGARAGAGRRIIPDNLKRLPRQCIKATDAEWLTIQERAQQSNLSVNEYMISTLTKGGKKIVSQTQ